MKTICLYFEIHQNTHLKRYRFFDIGTDHYYYDDYENSRSITETAEKSYIPALKAIISMAKSHKGYFKCAVSISGCAIEMLENFAPEVLDLISELLSTGCCELLAEPYSHGLSSLANPDSFKQDVEMLCDKVHSLFGAKPKVFRNSCLIYSDDIGKMISDMGFKVMLTEGAKHILGWKSPHFVYNCALAPKLKLLLRDYRLSEDISLRFNDSSWSEFPLFADKYMNWISALPEDEQVINLFMELCALGIFQPLSSNILEFFKALPDEAHKRGITFSTPSEICSRTKSAGTLSVPYPISWVDEERDTSPWLGNIMQREAFEKLYSVADRVRICDNRKIKMDWNYLQATNNFRFMNTKPSAEGGYRGIYESPYDAFINYMNILGDFITRVNNLYPDIDNEELSSLLTSIKNQEEELEMKDKEIVKLHAIIDRLSGEVAEKKTSRTTKVSAGKTAKKKTAAKTSATARTKPEAASKKAEITRSKAIDASQKVTSPTKDTAADTAKDAAQATKAESTAAEAGEKK